MTDAHLSPGKATLLPCPFCGSEAEFERHGTNRQSSIISCQECGARVETGETWNEGQLWNTRTATPAQRAPGWIDQNHQIDRYGVALMMIGLGCADPAELATRVLSEFGVSLTSTESGGEA